MVMDKGEILRDYKAAADKTAQVKILADLNACSTEEIIDVLVEQGIERRRLSRVISKVRGNTAPKKVKAPVVTLEEREITVEEAVQRLRRELEELENRQNELDNDKAEFYSKVSDLLGVQKSGVLL